MFLKDLKSHCFKNQTHYWTGIELQIPKNPINQTPPRFFSGYARAYLHKHSIIVHHLLFSLHIDFTRWTNVYSFSLLDCSLCFGPFAIVWPAFFVWCTKRKLRVFFFSLFSFSPLSCTFESNNYFVLEQKIGVVKHKSSPWYLTHVRQRCYVISFWIDTKNLSLCDGHLQASKHLTSLSSIKTVRFHSAQWAILWADLSSKHLTKIYLHN